MLLARPPLVLFALAALLGAAGCDSARSASTERRSLATVNGQTLSDEQFDRFITVKLGEFASEPLDDSVRSELFDEFVKREVTAQAARERGIDLAEVAEAARGEKAAPRVDEQEIDLLVQRYYLEVVLKDVTVSPDEIANYYVANRSTYCPADGYSVREARATSREEAERLRRELAAGGTATVETRLYDPKALPSSFRKTVVPLADGKPSAVVESDFGFHVFVRERCAVDEEPPGRVRERVESDLRASKNERLVSQEVERLLREATVTVNRNQLSFNYEGRFAQRSP